LKVRFKTRRETSTTIVWLHGFLIAFRSAGS
jgi:hypothetical protein